MKKLLFLSIAFGTFISCTQGVPSLKFDGMFGNVQSVRESKYEAVEKFGEAIPDELEEVLILEFDKKGHLLKNFVYDDEGDLIYGWEQVYDGDVVIQSKNYNWREKEPVVTELISHDKGCYTYRFTSKDTTYSYSQNLFEDKLYRKITDTKGTSVSEIWFNKKGQFVEQKEIRNGELVFWIIRKYNEQGMLTEEELRGDYPNRRTIKYTEFDTKGNWITAIMFDDGDAYVLKRDIKYW